MSASLNEVTAKLKEISDENARLYEEMRECQASDDKKNWGEKYNKLNTRWTMNHGEMMRLDLVESRLKAEAKRTPRPAAKKRLEADPFLRYVQSAARGDGFNGLESHEIQEQRELQEQFGDDGYARKSDYIIPIKNPKERREFTLTEGANYVPTDTSSMVSKILTDIGGGMAMTNVIYTGGSGSPIAFPKTDDSAATGAIIADNATTAGTTDLATPGSTTIGAYTYTSRRTRLDKNAVADSAGVIDLVEYAVTNCIRRISRAQNAHVTTGTGTGQPEGFMTKAGVGPTIAASGGPGALVMDDLIKLVFSVDEAYLMGYESRVEGGNMLSHMGSVGFGMSREILQVVYRLRDTTGRPLLQHADFGYGNSPFTAMLLGYPIHIVHDMDPSLTGANKKSVVFGRVGAEHVARMSEAIRVRAYDDGSTSDTNSIDVIAYSRFDAKYIGHGATSNSYKYLNSKS